MLETSPLQTSSNALCGLALKEHATDRDAELLGRWARALSQGLLLHPVYLVWVSLLSLLYSGMHIAHQTYMLRILGWRLFLPKLFTKLRVLAEKFKELHNQTIILFPSHSLGTAIATLKGRKHGKKSFFSALLFRVPGLCCKHSLNPGFLHVSRCHAVAVKVCVRPQDDSNTLAGR